jgi:hypothetical protein
MDVTRESVYLCIGPRQLLKGLRLRGASVVEVARDDLEVAMASSIVRR